MQTSESGKGKAAAKGRSPGRKEGNGSRPPGAEPDMVYDQRTTITTLTSLKEVLAALAGDAELDEFEVRVNGNTTTFTFDDTSEEDVDGLTEQLEEEAVPVDMRFECVGGTTFKTIRPLKRDNGALAPEIREWSDADKFVTAEKIIELLGNDNEKKLRQLAEEILESTSPSLPLAEVPLYPQHKHLIEKTKDEVIRRVANRQTRITPTILIANRTVVSIEAEENEGDDSRFSPFDMTVEDFGSGVLIRMEHSDGTESVVDVKIRNNEPTATLRRISKDKDTSFAAFSRTSPKGVESQVRDEVEEAIDIHADSEEVMPVLLVGLKGPRLLGVVNKMSIEEAEPKISRLATAEGLTAGVVFVQTSKNGRSGFIVQGSF